MVESSKVSLPDPQIPANEEIQGRFYEETDDLVDQSNTKYKYLAYEGTIAIGSSVIRLWENIQTDL